MYINFIRFGFTKFTYIYLLPGIHKDELTTSVCNGTRRLGAGVVLIGQDTRNV